MTDDDIVAAVLDTPTERDSESDNEAETQCPVSHAEACSAFETALKWLEIQADTDPVHLLLVKKWRDTAAKKTTR